jgi:hypothetical protein
LLESEFVSELSELSTMKPPRNIIRIDNDTNKTHAWRVTLQRKKEVIVETFSDNVYGGKEEALKAAIEYRNVLVSFDEPFDHQIWIRTRVRKNNRSGIPGVGRYETITNPRTGRRTAFWLASWIDEHGASRKRKFSILRYGERKAKRLAIAEREHQLQRVCAIKAEQAKDHSDAD